MAAVRCRPDLVIVDAQLREGNGVSAVEQILRTGFVPHLFISGDIKKVLARRPDAVAIAKPFHEPELVQAIQRAAHRADRLIEHLEQSCLIHGSGTLLAMRSMLAIRLGALWQPSTSPDTWRT